MNSKQLNIVLGIVVVILLGLVGYMTTRDNSQNDTLSQNNTAANANLINGNANTTEQVNNTNTQTNKAAANTSSTTNWKTYSDTKHGFELEYPTNWTTKIENHPTSSIPLRVFVDPTGKSKFVIGSDCCREGVKSYNTKNVMVGSIKESYTLYNTCTSLDCRTFTGQKLATLEIDDFYIKDIKDYMNGFQIWFEFREDKDLATFEQILNSFKFTK
jgi:hypothetical protein